MLRDQITQDLKRGASPADEGVMWGPLAALGLALAIWLLLMGMGAGLAMIMSKLVTGSMSPVAPLHLELGTLVSSAVASGLAWIVIRARPGSAAVLSAPRGGVTSLIAVPVVFAVATLAYQLGKAALGTRTPGPVGPTVVDGQLTLLGSDDKWAVIVGAVVAAPLVEELILRGLLLPALARSRLRFAGAAVVMTLLFVIMHPGGLMALTSPAVLLHWHLILGLALCFVWWFTRSVWPCVLAHAAANMVLIGIVLRALP
jgi:membrane protease YdiL (CAAX protease family)